MTNSTRNPIKSEVIICTNFNLNCKVDKWLEINPDVEIISTLQSECSSKNTLTFTIMYREL